MKGQVGTSEDDPRTVKAIKANTAVLLEIRQILLALADSVLDQEEDQEPTEYLDGSPL